MKKSITIIMTAAILFSMILLQGVSASPPPESNFKYQYSSPKDFIQWLNDLPQAKSEIKYRQYINAYKKNCPIWKMHKQKLHCML